MKFGFLTLFLLCTIRLGTAVAETPNSVAGSKPLIIVDPQIQLGSPRESGRHQSFRKSAPSEPGTPKSFEGLTNDIPIGIAKPVPEPLAGANGQSKPSNVGEGRPFVSREQGVAVSESRPKGVSVGRQKDAGVLAASSKDFDGETNDANPAIAKGGEHREVVRERTSAPRVLTDADDSTPLRSLRMLEIGDFAEKESFYRRGHSIFQLESNDTASGGSVVIDAVSSKYDPQSSSYTTLFFHGADSKTKFKVSIPGKVETLGELKAGLNSGFRILSAKR